jgi:hypothetical protein
MPTLRISLDQETLDSLVAAAVRELRSIELQATAMLRRSLGLPFPYPAAVAPMCSQVSPAAEGSRRE